MMTRRSFVSAMGVLAAAGGLGAGIALDQRRRLRMGELVTASILPLRGSPVTLLAEDGTRCAATVAAVDAVRRAARSGAPATEQISLLVAAAERDTPGGNYRLQSPDLDLCSLNFSAVGPSGRQRRLEAVITRIL